MSETYPLVCTRGVVVFPGQEIVIDVGRKPSLDAVNNAQENYSGNVILISQKDLKVNEPDLSDIYEVGTLCEIRHIRRFDNFLRVKFNGLRRVRLKEWIAGSLSDLANVDILASVRQDETEEQALVRMVADAFEKIPNRENYLSKDLILELSKGMGGETLSDRAVNVLPLSTERKEAYLETLGVNDRLEMLLQDMAKEQKMNEMEQHINETVKKRIDDGQRDYYLREKLNVIKEELGDVVDQDKDVEQIRKRLEENPYPDYIKEKVKDELARYEMLPMASGETGIIKTYIDWLMDLPWWQQTKDNEDLNKAQEILDADHYGLEKVKERIMEYLAVKQMTNSLNAPILCLVGPPGVGKTSLARSVARALGRKFVKMSLGGVRDEAEIRGHRRTYLGAMPGRIIQSMKKAGVTNPVFLIDELDKMASDYKGDPSSAMLEVLDPEQNSFFSDHYIEEPYDLSNVLFIATANYLDNIPPALRDRLEIIELSSYTDVEKIHIAKEHLIPKQIKENGLKPSQLKINDKILLYLIRYYTREAGVRQLERTIAHICRKTVLAILKDNKRSVNLTKKLVHEWLGNEKVDYGKKEKKNQVGTVTGLAYTSFGGDILQIEANKFEGKGRLILTGQLGDVMKESASIAMDYIKAHAKEYHIDPKMFENNDVHVHVPEGAVPKDGPSAGVTMTTALVSCFSNIPVKSDLAMTGEVTLRGNVLPIGGLKEKSLAAYRSGIDTIIIPKENERDLDEIPSEVKDSVKFIPVTTVKQVLQHALVQ
ncbi:endopeptidase La [Catenisphaera adipataccumulans]|jgi:ATP-dependent Lon protease|uniref:Lon protease n=1 Tax=Catenisphaera adipataccumulans TaxID=700500 RepID=A0A7W8CYZ9_9FIRM|nr:endopeptidase La [Catenisphaera adipataccumulans]MBB5183614.1 ATP-dependent Lon protease [Catenisphaera adipataccumulans]